MIQRGYGQYTLNGIYCTNSFILDYATDDENIKYRGTARRHAELFDNNNK